MDYYNSDIMEDEDYLHGFSKRFKAPLVDRTGTLNRDLAVISKIPSDKAERDLNFNKITNNRAKIILKKAEDENKDIKVSYSGGIDSTTVMVALIKNRETFPKVKITVVLSKESVKEYPKFYNKYIKDKFPLIWANKNNLDKVLAKKDKKDFLIVTGELGDQLFGSALMFRDNLKDDLGKDWTKIFTPRFVRYWKPLVEQNPQKDRSVANVLWWLNFTLKYQWIQLRMFAMLGGKVPLDNFIHFFGGPRFQRWALATPMSVKFPDLKNEKSYKDPAKQYIYNYTKDKNYLNNKTKKGSLKDNLDAPIKSTIHRITSNRELIKK